MLFRSLERILELKDILPELCDMHRFNGERSARLRRYILSTEEWAVLEQLYRLLDVRSYFSDPLLIVSSSS